MAALAAASWALLVCAMAVDEFYFHRRRGLPRWERIGHPVDTAGMLACFAVALLAPVCRASLAAFAALAVLSMALVTKDETVHLERCGPGEARLHAALFMLHPLALLSALAAWLAPAGGLASLGVGPDQAAGLRRLLAWQCALGLTFFIYQVVYWNFLCEPAPASTTTSTIS